MFYIVCDVLRRVVEEEPEGRCDAKLDEKIKDIQDQKYQVYVASANLALYKYNIICFGDALFQILWPYIDIFGPSLILLGPPRNFLFLN